MGLFSGNGDEAKRKQNLRELEDKRLRFVQTLNDIGFAPDIMLFAQQNGGFAAISKCGNEFFLLTGPAPGAEEDFSYKRYSSLRARVEEILIKSEGMGGVLGFGKKGGVGYKMILDAPDGSEFEFEIVAGRDTFMEFSGEKNPFLSTKRRRGNANFVWDFRPVERDNLMPLQTRWLEMINGQAEEGN